MDARAASVGWRQGSAHACRGGSFPIVTSCDNWRRAHACRGRMPQLTPPRQLNRSVPACGEIIASTHLLDMLVSRRTAISSHCGQSLLPGEPCEGMACLKVAWFRAITSPLHLSKRCLSGRSDRSKEGRSFSLPLVFIQPTMSQAGSTRGSKKAGLLSRRPASSLPCRVLRRPDESAYHACLKSSAVEY